MTRNQGENCQKWGKKWGSNWSALSRLNVDSLYTLGLDAVVSDDYEHSSRTKSAEDSSTTKALNSPVILGAELETWEKCFLGWII